MLGRRRKEPEAIPEPEAPGWDTIDRAAAGLYGAQVPRHVGYSPGLHFGSGLQGCSSYWADDHWHFVSYGLTELWAKDAESDPGISGWSYELTMRVRSSPEEPPAWAFNLLETIARHTRDQLHPFQVGDCLDPGGPITGASATRLTAVAFTLDGTLPRVASPNGTLEFRQLVGVTADELAEMRSTSTNAVLDRLKTDNPLLVTDPSR
jgi:hypothetical protein